MPQFDPKTGKYCGFEHYEGQVAQVLFLPVSPRLAELIKANGDKAEPSVLSPLTFDVDPGQHADMHRVGNLRLDPMHVCGFCEVEFPIENEVCPRCLAKNQWYCGKCDALVADPIIDQDNDQIRCPACERTDPRGLRQIQCVGEFCEERLFTHYVLQIETEKHIILDYKRLK